MIKYLFQIFSELTFRRERYIEMILAKFAQIFYLNRNLFLLHLVFFDALIENSFLIPFISLEQDFDIIRAF